MPNHDKKDKNWFSTLEQNSKRWLDFNELNSRTNRSMVGDLVSSIVSGKVGIFNYRGKDRDSLFKYINSCESLFKSDVIKTIYEDFPSYNVLKSIEEIDTSIFTRQDINRDVWKRGVWRN